MRTEIIKRLEEHLTKIEQTAAILYVIQLRKVIDKLIRNEYKDDEALIKDLNSLGFNDLAQLVRRERFL